jgi:tetratricopeptide (TPR) repeat protein
MPRTRTSFLFFLLLGLPNCLRGESELEKARLLIKAKSYQEAQILLDRTVKSDPANAEAWYQLGNLQKATHHPEKALECADRAIQINPGKANYYVLRGNSLGDLATQANMFKALSFARNGLAALEKAAQMEPGNRHAVGALYGWYVNVPAIGGGSRDKAKALAERTLAPDPAMGHYLKGLALQKQNNPGPAQAEFRLTIGSDPKFPDAYLSLAYVELQMKQVDQALEHFRKQVELDPENANSFDSLGEGLMAKGRAEEAISAYRKALSLDPDFYSSMRGLGNALEQAGRRDEAIQHYRHCEQVGIQKGIPQLVSGSKERLKGLGVKD